MTDRKLPLEDCPHPSIFIREELDARGWNLDDLAARMGPDFGINRIALDFYMEIGPDNRGMKLGDCAAQIARAFGVSTEYLLRLERRWRDAQEDKQP